MEGLEKSSEKRSQETLDKVRKFDTIHAMSNFPESQDLVLQPTELTDRFGPKNTDVDDFEFLSVEISRKQYTTIYLKVPIGWRPKGRDYKLLAKAAEETTERYDWDECAWPHTVEMESFAVCDKNEAQRYLYYEIPRC